MKIEEMTDAQIDDYLREFEYQKYKQLEKVSKEQAELKKIETQIQKLKAERNVRNSRIQQLKIGG